MASELFGRFTSDAEGDLSRTWCYQPADLADAFLPSRSLSAGELAEAIDAIADEDPSAARTLRGLDLEWTGENWSTREDGIPGLALDEDEAEDVLSDLRDAGTVNADADAFVVYEGRWVGEEYESSITSNRACRFLPERIVRVIDL